MPKSKPVPSYRRHRPSGQAIVTLPSPSGERRDVYLGRYNSAESKAAYARAIAEWETNGRRLRKSSAQSDLSINELAVAYLEHADEYYRKPDGTVTTEVRNIKTALAPLISLYGLTEAGRFDSLALETVREKMIEGHCRTQINKAVHRIKRMFKWGAARKILPVEVFQQIATVEGLRAGRSDAKESKPIKPVPVEFVHQVLPHLLPQVRAMVELQLLCGMRSGEVCSMRTIDLDTSGKVWLYRPQDHKTAHHGHERIVPIGPHGQEVLKPWLRLKVDEPLFQPREAVAWMRGEQRKSRQTPLWPSHLQAKVKKRRRDPHRSAGEHYNPAAYAYSIRRTIDRLNKQRREQELPELPRWHPHQLRHTAATLIRKEAGLDAARIVLGHHSAGITAIYAEADFGKAIDVMAKLG